MDQFLTALISSGNVYAALVGVVLTVGIAYVRKNGFKLPVAPHPVDPSKPVDPTTPVAPERPLLDAALKVLREKLLNKILSVDADGDVTEADKELSVIRQLIEKADELD